MNQICSFLNLHLGSVNLKFEDDTYLLIPRSSIRLERSHVVVALLLLVLCVLPLQVLSASPRETVEAQVNKALKTLAEPAFKDQPRDTKIAKIRTIVNEIFDYTELSKRTLGLEWTKFNDQQQAEFIKLFSDLLEKTYADRVLSYSNEKVVFDKETMLREGQAEVTSNIIMGDGKEIPINYRLISKGSTWWVYDVIIEGVSLVKNYRDQFRDILAKDSPEEVLKMLRDKVKQR